jgi:hypothetical protein
LETRHLQVWKFAASFVAAKLGQVVFSLEKIENFTVKSGGYFVKKAYL